MVAKNLREQLVALIPNASENMNTMTTAEIQQLLERVQGGREVLEERELSVATRRTPAAEKIAEDARLMELERRGVIRRGSGSLPSNFWELPRPEDPDGSVRQAVEQDRR